MAQNWWWGTYPAAGAGTPAGTGEGLWRQREGVAPVLALELPAPSFVVAHPDLPLLYAVSETDPCIVHCVDVADPEAPFVRASLATGGRDGCHLLLSDDTLTLYVAHYSSGDLAVIRLGLDGGFDGDAPLQLLGHTGSGPNAERQEAPHAHFVDYAPGRKYLLVADLGTDELRRYRIEGDGQLVAERAAARLEPGSGPRHFAVLGDHLYVVCELDHRLRTFVWDRTDHTAEMVAEAPVTPVPLRSSDTAYDAHVVQVAGVVLASVRGPDVIAVFDIGGDGVPSYRTSVDAGGAWPRHFAIAGERLVVGHQHADSVAVFDLADVLRAPAQEDPAVPVVLEHGTAALPGAACCCPA